MELNIREQEETIFNEWMKKYPTAVKDGAVNLLNLEKCFLCAKIVLRVKLLYKEVA